MAPSESNTLTKERNALESDESMLTTESLLDYKNRIRAFSITVDTYGAFEVMVVPRPGFDGAIFKTGWKKGPLLGSTQYSLSLS